MKAFKKIKKIVVSHINYLLPAITLFLVICLIISYMVPKKVIDTYKTNTTEEEGDTEYLIDLTAADTITYTINTGKRPMLGIHIGVAKNGTVFTEEKLHCKVFLKNQKEPVSENIYALSQGEDMQYIYIPFENYEACIGDIVITFTYEPGAAEKGHPGILANARKLEKAHTEVNGKQIEGNIKSIYIYTHDTYPLVYDLKILTVVFFAASMAVSYRGRNKMDKNERGKSCE